MRPVAVRTLVLGLLFALTSSAPAADEATVALAGTRTHFSMAEPIEFAVFYKNDGGNAKTLPLEIRHSDGSTVTIDVPFDVPAGKSQARMVTLHPTRSSPANTRSGWRDSRSLSCRPCSTWPATNIPMHT